MYVIFYQLKNFTFFFSTELLNFLQSEIWNIDMVTREHGSGPLSVDDVENGLIRIDSHTKVTKG